MADVLTAAEVAAIRERADKAIGGPWEYGRHNWRGEHQELDWYIAGAFYETDGDDPCRVGTSVCVVPGNATSHPVCENVAAFIAAARLDVPRLCAAVDALRDLLRDYGRHSPGCSAEHGDKYRCECGWDAADVQAALAR